MLATSVLNDNANTLSSVVELKTEFGTDTVPGLALPKADNAKAALLASLLN
ncbi:hypothetical protein HanIR_Chr05g0232551 [Helianthus annuus]|nr:hypothetical protein HanIR_Chr05g0232551 [Helianthus annuus]